MATRYEELAEQISELEERIKRLDKGDYSQEDEIDYDEILDDSQDAVKIGTLTYSPSQVLKAVDPIAYNIGMDEYFDSRLEDLRSELEDFKDELAELSAEVQE